MSVDQLPLNRQIELVFHEINEELRQLDSGTVFIQIRNNAIGKFGVRHFPLESKAGSFQACCRGLTESQVKVFREMAVESLRHKKHWTHGEIFFEFALRQGALCASVQFESNYKLAYI
ncbi:hypothetical protein J31TS4_40720 [Paenibacillus sp. J31TS4]|uniref:O-methyltransferase n=1 Tax=Paenibacillus sp. J31TS4 TaxID=2807195 RepID=UPI001B082E17|nr:O-methyltransferase [Paenibacillus sp. J31TS4]GIP40792.1 hypothetical protein J31TS4_40720 [Paenibacillus sp. J31TS4]